MTYPNRHPRRPSRPAGFTFVEVMFATIILGIGLIMVAALLPVGMRQTTDTADAITGRAVAENGFFTLQAVANEDRVLVSEGGAADGYYSVGLPVTEQFNPSTTPLSELGETVATATLLVDSTNVDDFAHPFAIRGGVPLDLDNVASVRSFIGTDDDVSPPLIAAAFGPTNILTRTFGSRLLTADPRYGWVALYQRGLAASGTTAGTVTPSATAKVTVFALRSQTGASFRPADLWHPANQPQLFEVSNLRGASLNNGVLVPAQITLINTDVDDSTPGMVRGQDYPNDDYTGDIDWNGFTKMNTLATGAYVVIANDNIVTDRLNYSDFEGVVLRLGERLDNGSDPDTQTYLLDLSLELPTINTPSGELPDGSDENPLAWVIGRQAVLEGGTVQSFDGRPMPIGFFQAKLPLR